VKVVFLEDVPGTANIGEIKDVKNGFARNYLLPRRLAAPATPAIIKSAEARAVKEARLQDARDADARAIGERLAAASFTFTAKAGPAGKLFGSVGVNDIAGKVAETLGQDFDRHNVLLSEPIKELTDDRKVNLRLTRNVNTEITVTVVGEDGTTAADIRARAEREAGEEAAPAAKAAPEAGDAVEARESADESPAAVEAEEADES
jgi:large subunit ribosomal protein L9